MPIVVGGTSYWIQHLLFPNRLVSMDNTSIDPSEEKNVSETLAKALSTLPPELLDLFRTLPHESPSATEQPKLAMAMHQLLTALDPSIAQRFHWKDTRKTLRQLTIIKDSGRLSSEIIAEQSLVTPRPKYVRLDEYHFLEILIEFSGTAPSSFGCTQNPMS